MFGATFVARSLVVLLGTGAVFGLGWFVFRTAGGAAISGFDRSRSGILAPTGETPVITTAEAAQVLRDYWRRHELALMQDDLAQLGKTGRRLGSGLGTRNGRLQLPGAEAGPAAAERDLFRPASERVPGLLHCRSDHPEHGQPEHGQPEHRQPEREQRVDRAVGLHQEER